MGAYMHYQNEYGANVEAESLTLVFSKARHGNQYISPNFKVKEFACKDGSDLILIDPRIVRIAQAVRDRYGSYTFNSAYRTPEYNRRVKGATTSQHMLGRAIDIPCSPLGIDPDTLAAFIESLPDDYDANGIGIYYGYNFVHVDVKNRIATWHKD